MKKKIPKNIIKSLIIIQVIISYTYCILNNYMDENENPLINKMMRNKFYEFCYDNSRK